ncbi:pleiotropic regulatory protein RsmS [Aeromonas encheleia]|uniref:Pleiotropic regulatory protein RsmS n=1 Tax=Aeromonas encheleia TaxID=73010 RepID=A0AAE9MD63_9GAMM|nr:MULTISPECIES: pleiotropic regulatory protein RsmS [Aeromonas]MBV7436074.1 pleiotropic regulatory protein RsmS [Aeromonas sp. sif2416]UNP87389.1 pleiotropic regulatory protein RsmS [Aeromonas encheleia]USV56239.1 pleiotropic regulatory protein RsmS [Aeromonas encheleia]
MSLENAPPEVKLAVDLIELLETNQIDPALALAALAIVQRDYERKIQQGAEQKSQPGEGQDH